MVQVLPIDRDSTAKILGFSSLVENSIDATSTRDFVAEYVANSAIMMTNLSRLSEDFIIWSSAEFSFIELSDDFTSPSSVMPQKKNPDILELTRGKTSQVIGYLTSILTTTKGLIFWIQKGFTTNQIFNLVNIKNINHCINYNKINVI